MNCISSICVSQVRIPINIYEQRSCEREQGIVANRGIVGSQMWLYTVRDNVLSKTKRLVSAVRYNAKGQPERVDIYDTSGKVDSFVRVRYNRRNLPFEEVVFKNDSTMLGGTLYEYSDDGSLQKQSNYDGRSPQLRVSVFEHKTDTVDVVIFDVNGVQTARQTVSLSRQTHRRQAIAVERIRPETHTPTAADNIAMLTSCRPTCSNASIFGKSLIYNEEGDLIRSVACDAAGNVLDDTSFEYDKNGLLSRIINNTANTMNVFFINYFDK